MYFLIGYLGVAIFNIMSSIKMRIDTRNRILKLIEDKGYIFDKHYYGDIFQLYDGNKCSESFSMQELDQLTSLFFINLIPGIQLIPVISCITYLSGNYNSFLYEIYDNYFKFIKTNIDNVIEILNKEDRLTKDSTFEYKKKLDEVQLNSDEKLANLMDKYNKTNTDNKKQIIVNCDDDLDILIEKINELEQLVKSKQEQQNIDEKLKVYKKEQKPLN